MTNFCWYYHDRTAGAYHAIERHATGPSRSYRAVFCLDPETGKGRSYTGPLPTKAAAAAVLQHLAPEAEPLPGPPAYMR